MCFREYSCAISVILLLFVVNCLIASRVDHYFLCCLIFFFAHSTFIWYTFDLFFLQCFLPLFLIWEENVYMFVWCVPFALYYLIRENEFLFLFSICIVVKRCYIFNIVKVCLNVLNCKKPYMNDIIAHKNALKNRLCPILN
jgi:hypothetical protein